MNAGNRSTSLWYSPQQAILLPDDEVHIWHEPLDQPRARIQSLFGLLAPEEKERAERYHFRRDCDHFIVARGLLRTILGRYLNLAPNHLQFSYSTFGKPYLEPELYGNLCFNLSHSDGLALLAVARGRKLGIDVERIRPEIIKENVAEHFFSPEEVTKLRSLPVDQQAEAFFNCWTRKEAYIKARGEGLSIPLDHFNVSLMPGEPAALLEMKIDPEEVNRWHMMELVSGSSFKAALVVEGQGWQVRYWPSSESSL